MNLPKGVPTINKIKTKKRGRFLFQNSWPTSSISSPIFPHFKVSKSILNKKLNGRFILNQVVLFLFLFSLSSSSCLGVRNVIFFMACCFYRRWRVHLIHVMWRYTSGPSKRGKNSPFLMDHKYPSSPPPTPLFTLD